MDIEIKEQKQNALLSRAEVRFTLHHPNAQTPTRDAVREKLASQLSSKKGLIVVDHMSSAFGKGMTRGYARVYQNVADIGANEPDHLLKRNKLEDAKPKKGKTAKKEA